MSDSRWLIAGLGNPGSEYEKTRHNVGFMAIQHLAETIGITGKREGKFNAIVANGQLADRPVILAQPLTYMNLSGEAIGKILQYYKIPPEQMLIIYDDAALPFGKLRVRPGGSSGGQKGMKSIIQTLGGNEKFPRLRIGIGAPEGQRPLHSHVLSAFNAEEQKYLANILDESARAVRLVLEEGVETAMCRFNGMEIVPPPEP